MSDIVPFPRHLQRLLEVMARLRDREHGCPWDLQQDFSTIAPYTIEEAYEVAAAIEQNDMEALRDELGDLLLQVVFHARMAEEAGCFTFDDVAESITEKMIRRHPHVFGDESFDDVEAQKRDWEAQKASERAAAGATSVLDGVAIALPALIRAEKLQKRAARIGFDWPDWQSVFEKVVEELEELQAELVEAPTSSARQQERIEDEVGDLLFATANLARHLKIDPEQALRKANSKFERRFRKVESSLLARGREAEKVDLNEMEAAWQEAKRQEKPG